MARRRGSFLGVTGEQAQQALSFLIDQGKIAARDVQNALKRRERLVREIRERLARLGGEAARLGVRVRRGARAGVRAAGRIARRTRRQAKPVTAARRAAMKAQGHYLGAIARLPKASRAKVKAIREKSGVKAAIAAAKRMAK